MFGLFQMNNGKTIKVNDIDELIGNIELIDIYNGTCNLDRLLQIS